MSQHGYQQRREFPKIAREHNEKLAKERLGEPKDIHQKLVPDFPEGEQIAIGVYRQSSGTLFIGDKY